MTGIDWLTIILAIFVSVYLATFLTLLIFVVFRCIQKGYRDRKFKKSLFNGLKRKLITNISDIDLIYSGIYEIEKGRSDYCLARLLRKCVVNINFNETVDNDTFCANDMIKKAITEIDRRTPFSSLNQDEQNMFEEVIEYCDDGNMEAIRKRLRTVAERLKHKNDEIKKSEGINKVSIPLAIAGLILTIISMF